MYPIKITQKKQALSSMHLELATLKLISPFRAICPATYISRYTTSTLNCALRCASIHHIISSLIILLNQVCRPVEVTLINTSNIISFDTQRETWNGGETALFPSSPISTIMLAYISNMMNVFPLYPLLLLEHITSLLILYKLNNIE